MIRQVQPQERSRVLSTLLNLSSCITWTLRAVKRLSQLCAHGALTYAYICLLLQKYCVRLLFNFNVVGLDFALNQIFLWNLLHSHISNTDVWHRCICLCLTYIYDMLARQTDWEDWCPKSRPCPDLDEGSGHAAWDKAGQRRVWGAGWSASNNGSVL